MLIALALSAPSAGTAQPAAASQQTSPFQSLWTSWSGVSRQSLTNESQALERVREDFATGGAERQAELRNEGRALGERVGEIVRAGDCEDGERVARQAGDFALVEAVRTYCRQVGEEPQSETSPR